MAVRARTARTGVYQYTGAEVDPENKHGLRDTAVVNVLRDEAAVFDERAVRSFIGKPITDDHPREAVTADNWREHARGTVMGAVRDGDYLSFDLLLTDAPTVAKVNAGKRELSNGYACDVEIGSFTAADGTVCQARQKPGSIVGNHVALVDRGRAGSECAICDTIPSNILDSLNTQKTETPVKTMVIDGLTVDMANADTAIATVQTLIAARDGLKTRAETAEGLVTARDATIVSKDAEIVALKADKAALEAAKPTPAQLRDAAKAYAVVVAKGKAAGITVTDAMGEDEIKKAVVDKAMPGNTYTPEHVAIAFDALTKDAKVADAQVQPLGQPAVITDEATAYVTDRNKAKAAITSAWKTPFNAADAAAA